MRNKGCTVEEEVVKVILHRDNNGDAKKMEVRWGIVYNQLDRSTGHHFFLVNGTIKNTGEEKNSTNEFFSRYHGQSIFRKNIKELQACLKKGEGCI